MADVESYPGVSNEQKSSAQRTGCLEGKKEYGSFLPEGQTFDFRS